MAIYDTLLRPTPGNGYLPELATKATIVSPEEITLQLRKGVVFSDGTPLTAQAVSAGILRNKNSNSPASTRLCRMSRTINRDGTVGVDDPVLPTRRRRFYPLLASEETFIASPKAVAAGTLATHPVGAGPFVLPPNTSRQQKIILVRNPKIGMARTSSQRVRVRERATGSSAGQRPRVGDNQRHLDSSDRWHRQCGRIQVLCRLASGAAQTQSLWMPVCKASGPLANVKIRQALNYGVDRTGINHAVLQGLGQPQWAIVPKGNLYFDPALNGYYA